jgi:hypothetical protein
MATKKPVAEKATKAPKAALLSAPALKKEVKVAKPKAEKLPAFPKAIGACADMVYKLREERKAAQKEVDKIEEREKALKEHIINNLPKSQTTGVAGKFARVTVVTKEVPQVKDWDAFYKHLKKTGEFDLLGRSIGRAAIEARWDAGKKVPGVEAFTAVTLSINKV